MTDHVTAVRLLGSKIDVFVVEWSSLYLCCPWAL